MAANAVISGSTCINFKFLEILVWDFWSAGIIGFELLELLVLNYWNYWLGLLGGKVPAKVPGGQN